MQISVKASAFDRLRENGFKPFALDAKRRIYIYHITATAIDDFLELLGPDERSEAKE